jgi:hypothetical protein
MRKRISFILILALSMAPVVAQDKVRDKAPGDASDAAQRKTEEVQRKTQAVDILKGVVETAADIQDLRTRMAVLTGALDLLWKYDEPYARANFIKSAASLSHKFASNETQKNERSEIRASMGVLLMAFARHDSQAASRLLDKFQKLLEDVLKGNSLSPSERLSIAQASLDSNAVESAALAAKVLEAGVPGSFPEYLNQLEQRDAAAAASLFRLAISILSSGRVYTPIHVTVLSTYVFREREMSVPVIEGGDGRPLEFGTFASPLSPATKDLNQPLVASYLAASGAYLNAQANELEQLANADAIRVALNFFLVKKLRGYVDKLGLNRAQEWAVLDTKYTLLAERAKISNRDLSDLASVAQRIVTENTVFRFDGGDSAFAAAEKTEDTAERTQLMAAGIRQLIEDNRFSQALQKIADLKDDEVREQLNTYLSFRTAEFSLKKGDWDTFNTQVNRVSDAKLRTYLVLSAAHAASDAKKKKMSSDFLLTAMASFPKIDDVDLRAAALVAAAAILSEADASWAAQVLTEGVNAINRTTRYDGRVYAVTLEVSQVFFWVPLPKSDLKHCFEQAAKRDWAGAIAAAQSIESKVLRSQAYIAACGTIL